MKKFLILIMLFLTVCAWSKGIVLDSELDLGFAYDSNINLLSDSDRDEFLDNILPEKYLIKSIDDLIMDMSYTLKCKNYWLGGHTQIEEFKLYFNKYQENSVKDYGYMSFAIRQYFSRNLDFSLKYYYYPQIYLRQYESVIDHNYHKFEYSKNYYSANLNWDIARSWFARYNLEYSQLFYNKWFTEYDADIFTSNIFLTWQPSGKAQIELRYGYRLSNADAEDAFADPDAVDVIKDASYEANIYSCQFKIKKLLKNTTFNIGYKLETRYFNSDNDLDTYHLDRNDYIHSITTSIYKPLKKNLSIIVSGEYGFRNTESPKDYVVEDKEYNSWKTSLNLSYAINLKK